MSQKMLELPAVISLPAPAEAEPVDAPNRWIFQLVLLVAGVCLISAAVFYFTTRTMLARGPEARLGTHPRDPMADVVSLQHGLAVYSANCATCHGAKGRGDGPQAEALIPRPRNFSKGWFKLGSTQSGLPTDADLASVIRNGMLPAAMPGWPNLAEGEVRSLVLAIRHMAIEGRVAEAMEESSSLPREKALRAAQTGLATGPEIILPGKPAVVDVNRGKAYYAANCAICHDVDGRALLRTDLVDNEEQPTAARDLTTGVFKGGHRLEDIAMRMVRGMPGSPMPGNPAISAEDLWGTAEYVKNLAKRGGAAAGNVK